MTWSGAPCSCHFSWEAQFSCGGMIIHGAPALAVGAYAVLWVLWGSASIWWIFATAWNVWGAWDLVLSDELLSITANLLGNRRNWTYRISGISHMGVAEDRVGTTTCCGESLSRMKAEECLQRRTCQS